MNSKLFLCFPSAIFLLFSTIFISIQKLLKVLKLFCCTRMHTQTHTHVHTHWTASSLYPWKSSLETGPVLLKVPLKTFYHLSLQGCHQTWSWSWDIILPNPYVHIIIVDIAGGFLLSESFLLLFFDVPLALSDTISSFFFFWIKVVYNFYHHLFI